jgi:hypothetical protein
MNQQQTKQHLDGRQYRDKMPQHWWDTFGGSIWRSLLFSSFMISFVHFITILHVYLSTFLLVVSLRGVVSR